MEKIAFKIVSSEDPSREKVTVSKDNIEDFIGSPIFDSKKFYEVTPPGVVVGLAYNAYGGSILYIEATKANYSKTEVGARGGLKVTGSLGDVMKESSSIAQTFSKNFLHKYFSKSRPEAVGFLEQ